MRRETSTQAMAMSEVTECVRHFRQPDQAVEALAEARINRSISHWPAKPGGEAAM
jgi:hypothetical protein